MSVSPRALRTLVIVHLAASWFMVGLIWTIHVVHYPLFPKVGASSFVAFETDHVARIGLLLLVPWVAEGVTLLGLLWVAFIGAERRLRVPTALNGLAMAAVLLISGFWSAPAHGKLMKGFDAAVHHRLMNADLLRTLAWSVCGVAAFWTLSILWSAAHADRSEVTA